MDQKQLKELLLQSLEHEKGGVKVYEAALKCARNEELREEWERYSKETETHVRILQDASRLALIMKDGKVHKRTAKLAQRTERIARRHLAERT